MDSYEVVPIGIFHAASVYPYDVPRQGVLAGENAGTVTLEGGKGYEQALSELAGFSHIWLLFMFHLNHEWHAKVQPPRHVSHKVGVFASRSPYRPNGIGMSVVRLVSVDGLTLRISGHDLLDSTPIVDIKPYLPYADSFPEASPGWTGEDAGPEYDVVYAAEGAKRLQWLENHGVTCIRSFAETHLSSEPLNSRRHRLLENGGRHLLGYRTWRLEFAVQGSAVIVENVFSGYSISELNDGVDKYGDKAVHRQFVKEYGFLTTGKTE